jgi:hypothetical protein
MPTVAQGLPGLELALKEPDLLDVEVTIQRTQLADRAGVFEMAIASPRASGPRTRFNGCRPISWLSPTNTPWI